MNLPTPNTQAILLRAFPGLREREAQEAIDSGFVCNYPPNTVLCREGQYEFVFYILLEGQVRVTKIFNDTEERLLKELSVGDFFGEMALIQNAPRAATVSTITETSVLEIRKDAFTRLVEGSSVILLAMAKEVSRRLTENDTLAIEDLRVKARQLATAYQQLAEQESARRAFLTTIAHELRTPLMTVNGYLDMIRMGMMQGESLNLALSSMSNNLEDITKLVNDLLFLQEMELILPEFQPIDAGAVVTSAVEKQRMHAAQANVTLRVITKDALPAILGDAKSLDRALGAIIDNAVKFSLPGGEVLVQVQPNDSTLWITVQDQGVGISEQAKPLIFERFFHIDQVGGRLFRGIGIGLSIARQVIEQHHGHIDVQSELGHGSTFSVSLPVSKPVTPE